MLCTCRVIEHRSATVGGELGFCPRCSFLADAMSPQSRSAKLTLSSDTARCCAHVVLLSIVAQLSAENSDSALVVVFQQMRCRHSHEVRNRSFRPTRPDVVHMSCY